LLEIVLDKPFSAKTRHLFNPQPSRQGHTPVSTLALAGCRQRIEKPNRADIERDAAQDSGRCEMALAVGAQGAFDQGFLEGHRGGMP
jgi:hypothetical protein